MPAKPARHSTSTHLGLTILAALLAMLGPFSIDTYLPSFPAIEQELSVNRATLTQSLSVYLAIFGITTLLWGPMSDHIGRRLVMLISLSIYVLASVGCAFADDASLFLIFRGLQGLGASGGFIAGRAMIRDTHDAVYAQKAMSQVMLLFALAPALAPLIGGGLQDLFGWRSIFWFLCIYAGLLMIVVFRSTETLNKYDRKSFHPLYVWQIYIRILLHARFSAISLSLSFCFAGLFLYIAGAPTILYDFLGMSTKDFGYLFIPVVAGLMTGAMLASYMADKLSSKRLIVIGFSLLLISSCSNLFIALIFEQNIVTVIGPLVVYSFGVAFIMPAITILALDCFPENRGSAASMQGFMQMTTNALAASIAVPLLHRQITHYISGQLLFLLIAIILWMVASRGRIPSSVAS